MVSSERIDGRREFKFRQSLLLQATGTGESGREDKRTGGLKVMAGRLLIMDSAVS